MELAVAIKGNRWVHGMSGTPIYLAWQDMKKRCYNPTKVHYKNYGGRGITVCNRWLESFANFFEDMGQKPTPAHTLERIDNNKGYEPGNCKWATRKEQANNFRRNRIVELDGRSQTMRQWADELGVNYSVLRSRIQRGWTSERALRRWS